MSTLHTSLLIVVFALFAAACSSSASTGPSASGDSDPDSGEVTLSNDEIILTGNLVPFSDCSALLEHIKSEARDRVGPYGLDYYGYGMWGPIGRFDVMEDDAMEAESASFDGDGAAAPQAATDSAGGDDSGSFTNTNTQEADVDEPDLIKTDGQRILVMTENRLTYVDVATGEATDTLTLTEGWGHELFFAGDRALLFTNGGTWGEPLAAAGSVDAEEGFVDDVMPVEPGYGYYKPSATIFEIDLSDPSDLQIAGTLRIEGQYLSARSVGDTVRLALSTSPSELPWVFPSNPAGEDRAEEANRELIDEMTIEDWVPHYELSTANGTESGALLDCDRLHRPASFSGFDVLSVLSFDLDGGLKAGEGVGVLASGQTVYSSTDRFYVATTEWLNEEVVADDGLLTEWTDSYETNLHAFSIGVDEPANYVASGSVPGSLLNQFSLDEHDGYLRVITTEGSPWNTNDLSETQLIVLQENGDELTQVGQVGGIGKGETLYSARLLDDVGFAVTFRQIDPFYVLDLSDPTNPQITGELKIPGFSTYLHPIGEDRVLGIGQDATDEGRVTGFKVSLFDVSNRQDPQEVATFTVDDANSPVEYDHRAFQMIGNTAIIPLQSWSSDVNGAILLEIGDQSITEVGQITHVPSTQTPTSDCDEINADQFSEDSEMFWAAQEGRVQLCGENDEGGYGDYYCDPIPIAQIDDWFGPDAANQFVEAISPDATDRIEMCWPNGGNWEYQINRSLVIDGDLWTMSQAQLQVNDLDTLETGQIIGLR